MPALSTRRAVQALEEHEDALAVFRRDAVIPLSVTENSQAPGPASSLRLRRDAQPRRGCGRVLAAKLDSVGQRFWKS
jgi:hypothetical protein